MDILKVLSRGIKKPARPAGGADPASRPQKLPSAGTKTHPQLFNDKVGGRPVRPAKRKRTSDSNSDSDDSDSDHDASHSVALPEVDFFAPKDDATNQTSAEPEPEDEPEAAARPEPRRVLSEDECKSLLRSHRLKFTLLSGALPSAPRVEKKKAKKKAKAEHKKEDKALYPQPLESFSELRHAYGIAPKVAENIEREGYKIPTEVQMGSLPLLLQPSAALRSAAVAEEGSALDLMAVAPTGSGKTISFLIPAIKKILDRRTKEDLHGIHELEAIVVAPTRELAFQIVNEGRKLTMGTGLRVILMKKGMQVAAEESREVTLDENSESESEDEDDDKSEDEDEKSDSTKRTLTKADILVTTPMPLLNFLTKNSTHPAKVLPTVRTLILDEADVLLDPLFLDQTTGVWSACTNPGLQATLWSATMGSNIETLATERLAARATALGLEPRPLVRLVVGLKDTAVPNVTHKLLYTGSENGKLLAIRQLLRPRATLTDPDTPTLRPPFLIFTQTIDRAAALETELRYDIPLEAGGGAMRIASLHSGLTDSARAAIMRRFRAGEVWVLITTDVLSRGVDFAGVNGIVNYDVPTSAASYVHRAGRTGRAGREGGVAVTLYTKDDIPYVKTVANVIAASDKQAGKTGDKAGVQKWLLDALPDVSKEDRKRLKERGVESRRSGARAKITSKSGYERRRENNRAGAVEAARRDKKERRGKKREADGKRSGGGGGGGGGKESGGEEEWGGIED